MQDVAELKHSRVLDLRTSASAVQRPVVMMGGGFSCKGNSQMTSWRAENMVCIAKGETSTGETFHAIKDYIVKFRPLVSILENVPQIESQYELEPGVTSSDAEYIREVFTDDGVHGDRDHV